MFDWKEGLQIAKNWMAGCMLQQRQKHGIKQQN